MSLHNQYDKLLFYQRTSQVSIDYGQSKETQRQTATNDKQKEDHGGKDSERLNE